MPAIEVSPIENLAECITAGEALVEIKSCDGSEVTGWKGGEYTLHDDNTLFLVSHFGTAGDSVTISEIYNDGYCVMKKDAY